MAATLQSHLIITSVASLGGPAKCCLDTSCGPKFTVVLSSICYSALHITLAGGLADTAIDTPVRDCRNLLKLKQILKRRCKLRLLKCPKEGEEEGGETFESLARLQKDNRFSKKTAK